VTGITLHLKHKDVSPRLEGWHLRLYRVIRDICVSHDITFEIRERDKDIRVPTRRVKDLRFQDGNLHIIDDRSVRAEGVLNAGVAYFWEFWHLDPVGTKAFSSIGLQQYDPNSVKPQRAKNFSDNLRKRYLSQRKSKYGQPSECSDFPPGAVAVFFQGDYPANSGATRFSDLDVLQAVQSGAGDRPIIVKPHPLASTSSDADIIANLARDDPRIVLSDGNVHDILAASALTASVNSTVALEGFMHGVPAVLFGTSDFHHIATTIKTPDSFAAALDAELHRDEDYDRFLAWYFLKHCLPLNSGKLEDMIWQRFENAGFPKARFT
jgi:hypothetical protein